MVTDSPVTRVDSEPSLPSQDATLSPDLIKSQDAATPCGDESTLLPLFPTPYRDAAMKSKTISSQYGTTMSTMPPNGCKGKAQSHTCKDRECATRPSLRRRGTGRGKPTPRTQAWQSRHSSSSDKIHASLHKTDGSHKTGNPSHIGEPAKPFDHGDNDMSSVHLVAESMQKAINSISSGLQHLSTGVETLLGVGGDLSQQLNSVQQRLTQIEHHLEQPEMRLNEESRDLQPEVAPEAKLEVTTKVQLEKHQAQPGEQLEVTEEKQKRQLISDELACCPRVANADVKHVAVDVKPESFNPFVAVVEDQPAVVVKPTVEDTSETETQPPQDRRASDYGGAQQISLIPDTTVARDEVSTEKHGWKQGEGLNAKVQATSPTASARGGVKISCDETPEIGASAEGKVDKPDTSEHGGAASTSNIPVGERLLKKHGWKEGEGLGAKAQGLRTPPVFGETRTPRDRAGLGSKARHGTRRDKNAGSRPADINFVRERWLPGEGKYRIQVYSHLSSRHSCGLEYMRGTYRRPVAREFDFTTQEVVPGTHTVALRGLDVTKLLHEITQVKTSPGVIKLLISEVMFSQMHLCPFLEYDHIQGTGQLTSIITRMLYYETESTAVKVPKSVESSVRKPVNWESHNQLWFYLPRCTVPGGRVFNMEKLPDWYREFLPTFIVAYDRGVKHNVDTIDKHGRNGDAATDHFDYLLRTDPNFASTVIEFLVSHWNWPDLIHHINGARHAALYYQLEFALDCVKRNVPLPNDWLVY